MSFRVTDIALLIKGHEFRNQDFESAVYDVIDKAAGNLTDEQKAHVYASIVESSQPHTTAGELEEVIKSALRGMPR
jgi:hypothetical protein